jgi:hypothetical protein
MFLRRLMSQPNYKSIYTRVVTAVSGKDKGLQTKKNQGRRNLERNQLTAL